MVIVLIGPMGCGKTTIGKALSKKLNWKFADADDYHPQSNINKMKKGIPLSDDDRLPWLQTLDVMLQSALTANVNLILACSALKQSYRDILQVDQQAIFSVYLKANVALLKERIAGRKHQFMANELLKSQLKTMEEPKDGLVIDIAQSPESITHSIIGALDLQV